MPKKQPAIILAEKAVNSDCLKLLCLLLRSQSKPTSRGMCQVELLRGEKAENSDCVRIVVSSIS